MDLFQDQDQVLHLLLGSLCPGPDAECRRSARLEGSEGLSATRRAGRDDPEDLLLDHTCGESKRDGRQEFRKETCKGEAAGRA